MNSKNNKFLKSDIYRRFIENRYTQEDLDYIIKHIIMRDPSKSPEKVCEEYWYNNFNKSIEAENESNFLLILEKIHRRISEVKKIKLKRRVFETHLKVFYRIAAIIIISLFIAGLSYYLISGELLPWSEIKYSEIVTPVGSRIRIDLPDGSEAWLNQGTILKYPQNFRKHSRELYLTGEAYFNVKKYKKYPFILKTQEININVVGTSFNVMAYSDEPEIEVTLTEGKLDLYLNEQNKLLTKITSIVPGEHVTIDRNSKKILKTVYETDKYIAWKDGLIIFRTDPMNIVIKRLERWFNIEMILLDEELNNYYVTATFEDENLQQVLHLLSIAVPLDYKIVPGMKQTDNSFSNDKVILTLKDEKKHTLNKN